MRSKTLAAVGAAALLAGAGCGEDESEQFSGERGRIAQVVEDFESGMDDADGPKVCGLFTAEWARAIGAGAGGCPNWVKREMEGHAQAPIDVRDVRLQGSARAVADVEEKGERLQIHFQKVGGEWKISRMTE